MRSFLALMTILFIQTVPANASEEHTPEEALRNGVIHSGVHGAISTLEAAEHTHTIGRVLRYLRIGGRLLRASGIGVAALSVTELRTHNPAETEINNQAQSLNFTIQALEMCEQRNNPNANLLFTPPAQCTQILEQKCRVLDEAVRAHDTARTRFHSAFQLNSTAGSNGMIAAEVALVFVNTPLSLTMAGIRLSTDYLGRNNWNSVASFHAAASHGSPVPNWRALEIPINTRINYQGYQHDSIQTVFPEMMRNMRGTSSQLFEAAADLYRTLRDTDTAPRQPMSPFMGLGRLGALGNAEGPSPQTPRENLHCNTLLPGSAFFNGRAVPGPSFSDNEITAMRNRLPPLETGEVCGSCRAQSNQAVVAPQTSYVFSATEARCPQNWVCANPLKKSSTTCDRTTAGTWNCLDR